MARAATAWPGLAVLAQAVFAVVPASAHPPAAHIIVLMGQSNMSGRGALDELPLALRAPDPAISVYGNDDVLRPATEPVDSAAGQVDQISRDAAAGVGPGLSFARSLLARARFGPIILVPCAKGGSALAAWTPATTRDTLYGSCLARVRAIAPQGRLAGILWYQGETDAKTLVDAMSWKRRFAAMITAFRAALGAPALPLVVVGLADQPEVGIYANQFPAWSVVRAAQASLRLRHQVHVAAVGLPRNNDGLHLSTAGQVTLGDAIAAAFATRFVSRRDRR